MVRLAIGSPQTWPVSMWFYRTITLRISRQIPEDWTAQKHDPKLWMPSAWAQISTMFGPFPSVLEKVCMTAFLELILPVYNKDVMLFRNKIGSIHVRKGLKWSELASRYTAVILPTTSRGTQTWVVPFSMACGPSHICLSIQWNFKAARRQVVSKLQHNCVAKGALRDHRQRATGLPHVLRPWAKLSDSQTRTGFHSERWNFSNSWFCEISLQGCPAQWRWLPKTRGRHHWEFPGQSSPQSSELSKWISRVWCPKHDEGWGCPGKMPWTNSETVPPGETYSFDGLVPSDDFQIHRQESYLTAGSSQSQEYASTWSSFREKCDQLIIDNYCSKRSNCWFKKMGKASFIAACVGQKVQANDKMLTFLGTGNCSIGVSHLTSKSA